MSDEPQKTGRPLAPGENPFEMTIPLGELREASPEAAAIKTEAQRRKARDTADAIRAHRRKYDGHGGGDLATMPEEAVHTDTFAPRRAPMVFERHDPGGDPITQEEREEFLQRYAECGVWNHSAYLVGRSGRRLRELAKQDPIFAIQVGEAVQFWRESLQGEVIRRGRFGTLKPIFNGKTGELVGHERVFSDVLLKMELEASWPSRYRVVQAPQDVNVNVNQGVMVVPGVASSRAEWEAEIAARPSSKTIPKVTRPLLKPREPTGE